MSSFRRWLAKGIRPAKPLVHLDVPPRIARILAAAGAEAARERDPFMRLFMQAEREAGAWTAEQAEVVSDACTHEAVFSDRSIPCTFPRGHEGRHSYVTAPETGPAT